LKYINNNTACPDMYEGWHFTQMWKELAWSNHFTKRGSRFGHILHFLLKYMY